jgi:hypothetical protein
MPSPQLRGHGPPACSAPVGPARNDSGSWAARPARSPPRCRLRRMSTPSTPGHVWPHRCRSPRSWRDPPGRRCRPPLGSTPEGPQVGAVGPIVHPVHPTRRSDLVLTRGSYPGGVIGRSRRIPGSLTFFGQLRRLPALGSAASSTPRDGAAHDRSRCLGCHDAHEPGSGPCPARTRAAASRAPAGAPELAEFRGVWSVASLRGHGGEAPRSPLLAHRRREPILPDHRFPDRTPW